MIPGLGRSPGVGNDNPIQYSCLENSLAREVWWSAFHGVTELDVTEHTHTQIIMMGKVFFLQTEACVVESRSINTFCCFGLEKAMAPHYSTLAWKIPWAEEPDRLQSMGSQRVGHN